jgi:hypothetical protein
MKSIGWMLCLLLLGACGGTEDDPPDARVAPVDGSLLDAPPFQIPDATPRFDAAPAVDAGTIDATAG